MKKNKMMRLAAILLVCVLMTTSVISGTFAKYTTSDSAFDSARVATWGFEGDENSIVLDNLFVNAYDAGGDITVTGAAGADVIAPGTKNSADFSFKYEASSAAVAPEVAYKFTVTATTNYGKDTYKDLDANQNFYWTLQGPAGSSCASETKYFTMEALLNAINSLDGTVGSEGTRYEPGKLPESFYGSVGGNATWTIGWVWEFESDVHTYDHDNNPDTPALNQDQFDTYMGNELALDELQITISIEATQVD